MGLCIIVERLDTSRVEINTIASTKTELYPIEQRSYYCAQDGCCPAADFGTDTPPLPLEALAKYW